MVSKQRFMNSVESVHNRVDSLFESAEKARQILMQKAGTDDHMIINQDENAAGSARTLETVAGEWDEDS